MKDQKGKNKEEQRDEEYQPQYATYDQLLDMEKRLKSHIDEGISKTAKKVVDKLWRKIDAKLEGFMKAFTESHSHRLHEIEDPKQKKLGESARTPKKKDSKEKGVTECVNIVSPEKMKVDRLKVKSKYIISPFLVEDSTTDQIIYTDFDLLRPMDENVQKVEKMVR